MHAYKFLAAGSRGRFSDFEWPQPAAGEAGAWVDTHSVEVCLSGIHACRVTDLLDWIDDELWLMELEGAVEEQESMVVAERGRLLHRIDEWNSAAAVAFADECAWRARGVAVRALRRDGASAEADRLDATDDLVDMQILAALASRRAEAASAGAAAFAADAVALARGQRPETWDLAVALAEPAPAQTPAATAANLGFVVAHATAADAVAESGDEASYGAAFAAERAWQLDWLRRRLPLEG
jgi:hypothetical protein